MAVSIAAIVGNVMVVEIMLKKQLDLNGFAMWLPIIEIESDACFIYTWVKLNRKSDSLSVPTALIWLYGWLHLDENGSCKGTAFDLLNILQLTSPSCYRGDSVDCKSKLTACPFMETK
ncbi:hypothetical protein WN943_011417 [Citrus x changshan-huyou]